MIDVNDDDDDDDGGGRREGSTGEGDITATGLMVSPPLSVCRIGPSHPGREKS